MHAVIVAQQEGHVPSTLAVRLSATASATSRTSTHTVVGRHVDPEFHRQRCETRESAAGQVGDKEGRRLIALKRRA
jgi:hypothetical protein